MDDSDSGTGSRCVLTVNDEYRNLDTGEVCIPEAEPGGSGGEPAAGGGDEDKVVGEVIRVKSCPAFGCLAPLPKKSGGRGFWDRDLFGQAPPQGRSGSPQAPPGARPTRAECERYRGKLPGTLLSDSDLKKLDKAGDSEEKGVDEAISLFAQWRAIRTMRGRVIDDLNTERRNKKPDQEEILVLEGTLSALEKEVKAIRGAIDSNLADNDKQQAEVRRLFDKGYKAMEGRLRQCKKLYGIEAASVPIFTPDDADNPTL